MSRSPRTIALALLGALAAVVLLLVIGSVVDARTSRGEVRRNVTIAGRDVGGMNADQLAAVMGELDERLSAMPVHIGLQDTDLSVESSASELGLHIDSAPTIEAALAVGGDTPFLLKPVAWVGSFVGHDASRVHLAVRPEDTALAVNRLRRQIDTEPVEPSVDWDGKVIVSRPGIPGQTLDQDSLARALDGVTGQTLDSGDIDVTAALAPVPPKVTDNKASILAQRTQLRTASPLPVRFGEEQRSIDPLPLRPFVGSEIDGAEIRLTLEEEPTLATLSDQITDVGEKPEPATFTVQGGVPVILDGVPGTGCCGPQSVEAVAKGLSAAVVSPVELSLTATDPVTDRAALEELQITQQVASFTTEHPCCAPRVDNIHRIADVIRGTVIEPGGTFSVNGTVGRRTKEKGFAAAPVIDADGNFDEDVGGGISQFATTMFNAGFFAGLEIPEYQAHGLYIARYPYGREATLSFPAPDLKITNNSPYGVLIWPTYTDTSITVTLYSTRWVDAAQTAQREEKYQVACTRVITTRTRTWLDGRSETDQFYALYAAGEGVQCDGTVRPKEEATTTTTAPPSPAPTTAPAPSSTAPASSAPPPSG